MFKEGTTKACKAALVGFGLFFMACNLRGMGVGASCLRAASVAVAVFVSVKIVYHLFISALLDGLSEFMRKDRLAKRTETDS
ncbi:MAG: hypothetical protein KJ645_01160 [Planctomycetes bacterium]|nr:hypothetical protein [Planctomycetota bacterium]